MILSNSRGPGTLTELACELGPLARAGTGQEAADQVRRTVIHEVAHHFCIDEERLTELGW